MKNLKIISFTACLLFAACAHDDRKGAVNDNQNNTVSNRDSIKATGAEDSHGNVQNIDQETPNNLSHSGDTNAVNNVRNTTGGSRSDYDVNKTYHLTQKHDSTSRR